MGSLAECLVKPFQTGDQVSVRIYEEAIRPRRWLTVVPVSREVLIEAARVRATCAAKLPDAIHIASYHLQNADALVTNDRVIEGALGGNCFLLSEISLD
jgi:hypothetical protein